MWIENASYIQFPRFHFRLDVRSNETFDTYQCLRNGLTVPTTACGGDAAWLNTSKCIAFLADQIWVQNDGRNWQTLDNQIFFCTITTFGTGYEGNPAIAFELEGDNWGMSGSPIVSQFFGPLPDTWIYLEKSTFQSSRGGPLINLWQSDLAYHSTNFTPNYYGVNPQIGSFFVKHYQPLDIFPGWVTIGDIGGIGFFMLILHTIVMIVIGIFLPNDSNFLSSSS